MNPLQGPCNALAMCGAQLVACESATVAAQAMMEQAQTNFNNNPSPQNQALLTAAQNSYNTAIASQNNAVTAIQQAQATVDSTVATMTGS